MLKIQNKVRILLAFSRGKIVKNKKRIIFIIVALIFFIVCIIFAIKKIYDIWGVKEIKGSGNPDIYKIVSLETKSLS